MSSIKLRPIIKPVKFKSAGIKPNKEATTALPIRTENLETGSDKVVSMVLRSFSPVTKSIAAKRQPPHMVKINI